MPELVRKWIAEAVHRELEAGKSRNRQSVLGAEAQSQDRDQVETEPADGHMGSRSDSSDSPSEAESSPSMEDEQWDQELSEEEGFLPEQPMFKGLFRPHLFKALLSKAKAVTKQGLLGEQSACPEQDPADMLFSEPTVETETVPAPKLFLDMIKKQWEAPAALPNMSSLERRFFNTASDLMELLRVPEVDDPVLALASSSATLVEPEEVLKPEDRKLEQALTKTHQAAAWGIRAATAASFFSRAVLLWLKQMQEKVPVTDLRTHQDFNKIVAAVEYTADATMSSAKYVAKSIASSVTARRFLWLKNWQADTKRRWRLASVPFKGAKLFGEALEPVLTETKGKKKVLTALSRRGDTRFSPSFRKSYFRPYWGSAFGRYQRGFQTQGGQWGHYHHSEEGSSDKGRSRGQSRRPFRGRGNRSFRRHR
ncbi:lamina-associated polypeptide 2-like [Ahaetulla prasina]|uniref:lamina-associated polypeptide 2-like n=1 Tax=Ahaetulla prasina TaxID=499056 RepID=UPI0026478F9E|nr:lamina-associated polypeptide 2-like [Ahaetulla prasina]